MKLKLHSKLTALWLMIIITVAAIAPPFGSPTPSALSQSADPACVDDMGRQVLPFPMHGAWLMVLNFNHAMHRTRTKACVITTQRSSPQDPITYDFNVVDCTVLNAPKGSGVGAGRASFSGNMSINCANGDVIPIGGPYSDFYINARAEFGMPNASYTIMNHQDAEFTVDMDNSWYPTLASRYGLTTYQNSLSSVSMAGQILRLQSRIYGDQSNSDRHMINGHPVNLSSDVAAFPYDTTKNISIGGQNAPWDLYEIIIDPAPSRCCFSN